MVKTEINTQKRSLLTPEDKIKISSAIALLQLKLDSHDPTDYFTLRRRIKYRSEYDYDLEVIADKVRSHLPICKWECSTFIEELLTYFGCKYPPQKKNERQETLTKILGYGDRPGEFYSDSSKSPDGFCGRDDFLAFVGLCVYHRVSNCVTRKNINIEVLFEVGKRSFELILERLR